MRSPVTLLYHGAKFRRLLRALLGAEDCYFIARDAANRIVGALPALLTRNYDGAAVLNSLPYYGSNGGLLEFDGDLDVRIRLIEAFEAHATASRCVASTIVTSPFETDLGFYERHVRFDLRDERIGQVTTLPVSASERDLFGQFHRKARNAIRKAQQLPLTISRERDEQAMRFLVHAHQASIVAKKGVAKSERFFSCALQTFEYGREVEVWAARHGSRLVAALLVFYFNQTVEYYTPVVVPEYRAWQPLSLIVLEAMIAASARGFRFWNWGGTWHSQQSLRRFKKRLGASDYRYCYYTRVLDADVLERSPSELLERYPNFYVVPFRTSTATGA